MNIASHNQKKDSLTDSEGTPLDWEREIPYKGVDRLVAQKCYRVQFTAAGRPMFIGTAYSQTIAAGLYDLALWRFLPKLDRSRPPNFPCEFDYITQERIDRALPRLNRLYQELPFIRHGDEDLTEEALRERATTTTAAPITYSQEYRAALFKLRRAHVAVSDWHGKLDRARLSLGMLHKLPDAQQKFASLVNKLFTALEDFDSLESSLELQAEYYKKLVSEDRRESLKYREVDISWGTTKKDLGGRLPKPIEAGYRGTDFHHPVNVARRKAAEAAAQEAREAREVV